jgi:hypothetical protein
MTSASTVFVPEGSFGVLDNGEIPAHTADWSNGLVAPMEQGVLIATGIHTGYVRVAVAVLDGPPTAPAQADWDEIVEVSVRAPTGSLRLDAPLDGPVHGLVLLSQAGPGTYRLRVHARGRCTLWDKSSTDPVEDYLVMSWPGPYDSTTILKSSDLLEADIDHTASHPHALLPPTPPTEEEEALLRRLREG